MVWRREVINTATTNILDALLFQMQQVVLLWIGLTVIFGIVAYLLYSERVALKQYADMVFILKRCKKERRPFGTVTNKAGTRFHFVVESDPDKPGLVKHKDFTLRNPNLASSKVRGHLSNGIAYVDYVVSCDFPMSHQSLIALDQLLVHVRNTHKELAFMDEVYVVEGVFKESKYAFNDCVQLVNKYIDMGVEIPEQFFYDGMVIPQEPEEVIEHVVEPITCEDIQYDGQEPEEPDEPEEPEETPIKVTRAKRTRATPVKSRRAKA